MHSFRMPVFGFYKQINEWVEVHTLLLDPHSQVEGEASLVVSLTTFSDDSIAVGDTISIDLGYKKGVEGLISLSELRTVHSFQDPINANCQPQKTFLSIS